jgi:hypothetical protein
VILRGEGEKPPLRGVVTLPLSGNCLLLEEINERRR